MPYIQQSKRVRFDPGLEALPIPSNPGELNYLITRILHAYIGTAPHYADYNAVIGVLECAKLELYRRRVAPYEDSAILKNGDVVLSIRPRTQPVKRIENGENDA